MPDSRETKCWLIWCPGQAGPSVVESWTPEQAVEFFLASHGMFGYDEIKMVQIDGINLISSVCSIVKWSDCDALKGYHFPTIIDADSFLGLDDNATA